MPDNEFESMAIDFYNRYSPKEMALEKFTDHLIRNRDLVQRLIVPIFNAAVNSAIGGALRNDRLNTVRGAERAWAQRDVRLNLPGVRAAPAEGEAALVAGRFNASKSMADFVMANGVRIWESDGATIRTQADDYGKRGRTCLRYEAWMRKILEKVSDDQRPCDIFKATSDLDALYFSVSTVTP